MKETSEQQAVPVAQNEHEVDQLVSMVSQWIGFSASCIKSGESWTHTCEDMKAGAVRSLDILGNTSIASLASVSSASAEPSALDWRKIAKAAGEHGVRYRTNTALERFLSDISAFPEPVPATNQAGEVELLPCPFCGGPGRMIHPMGEWVSREVGYGPDGSRISCATDACGLIAGKAFYGPDQDAEAITWWNTRAALATQPATSQEGEKPNRWYADAPKNIWLHGIGGGHETTWADDPSPTGDAEEEAHAVGYVRDDLAATPTPPTLSEDAVRKALERAQSKLGHVSIDAMNGDNLAVTLCTHFDDGEGDEDENGWTPAASDGCDATLKAIHEVYVAALAQVKAS